MRPSFDNIFDQYDPNRYIGNFMDKNFQGPFRDGFWMGNGESEGENKRGGGVGGWGVGGGK